MFSHSSEGPFGWNSRNQTDWCMFQEIYSACALLCIVTVKDDFNHTIHCYFIRSGLVIICLINSQTTENYS